MPRIELKRRHCFATDSAINSIDSSLRKPLLICAGSDRSVCVWDYESGSLRLRKVFTEEPQAVSFHPSGLAVAIGFADKLYLAHLLVDDIRTFWETPTKRLSAVAFSNGGQVLAAAYGTVVSLFDFHTGAKICDLDHQSKVVVSIVWGFRDSSLLSYDEEGNLQQWSFDAGNAECVGSFKINCSGVGTTARCFALASRESLWAINNRRGIVALSTTKHLEEQAKIIDRKDEEAFSMTGPIIASSNRFEESSSMAFVGMVQSSSSSESNLPDTVRIYSVLDLDSTDVTLEEKFTLLSITKDDRVLLVAGESGTLSVYTIIDRRYHDRQTLITAGIGESNAPQVRCRNVLVTTSALEEYSGRAAELESEIQDATMDQEYNERVKEAAIVKSITTASDSYRRQIDEIDQGLHILEQEAVEMKLSFDEKLSQMESVHQHKVHKLETAHRNQLLSAVDACQQARSDHECELKELEMQRQNLIQSHNDNLELLRVELEQELRGKEDTRIQLEVSLQQLQRELAITEEEVEDNLDKEIQALKTKYEERIESEKNASLHLSGENGILEKKAAATIEDIQDSKETVSAMLKREEDSKRHLKKIQSDISRIKGVCKTKSDAMAAKDLENFQLEQAREEAQKFVYVLDDKIKVLSGQIIPCERKVEEMDARVENLSVAIEHCQDEKDRLTVTIDGLRNEIDEKQAQCSTLRKRMSNQDTHFRNLMRDLDDCTQLIQHPTQLAKKIEDLGNRTSKPTAQHAIKVPVQTDISRSSLSQQLESELSALKAKQANALKTHQRENQAQRRTNEALLSKIRTMRGTKV